MSKMKNKKRLSAVVVALMLVFVIGAAFAMTPGTLTLTGRVYVEPDLTVVWSGIAVDNGGRTLPGDPTPAAFEVSTDGQTLTVNGIFNSEGDTVTITTYLTNTGVVNAVTDDSWGGASPLVTQLNAAGAGFYFSVVGLDALEDLEVDEGDTEGPFNIVITLTDMGASTDWPVSAPFEITLGYSAQ